MGYRIERLVYSDVETGEPIREVGLRWDYEPDFRLPTTEEMREAIISAKADNLEVDFIEIPRMVKFMGVEVWYTA